MNEEPETRAPGDSAGKRCDHVEPSGDQGELVTLVDVLGEYESGGFAGQFGEHDGRVRCFSCRRDSDPGLVAVAHVRRLEGASDPADMLMIVALSCPRCGAPGTLTLNYGPEGTPGEAAVLRAITVDATSGRPDGLSQSEPG